MESVIEKIRQARDKENKRRAGANTTETIVDGCQVSLRFNSVGDKKALTVVKSMLISSHLDATLTSRPGGDCV